MAQRQGRIEEASGYHRVYQYLKRFAASEKAAWIDRPNVGLTEHPMDDSRRLLVLVNYDPEPAEVALHLRDGWNISRFLKGSMTIPGNDCAILEICTV